MLIELNLLPPTIAEQINQVPHGAVVQFANNGQVIANLSKPHNPFLNWYINTPFDVADTDLPEFNHDCHKFDDPTHSKSTFTT